MAKTRTEKIESIQTQIQELENQRKRLIQQQKAQDRRDRTHRLIERGAAAPEKTPWTARTGGTSVNGKDMDTTRETG